MKNHLAAVVSLFLLALLFASSVHASPLTVGVVEGAKFGYRYDGVDGNRRLATFEFSRQSTNLILSYVAYDIDRNEEVAIELNGRPIGHAIETPNGETRRGTLTIDVGQMVAGENTLVFRQRSPGYVWGVTDLRLDRDSTQRTVFSLTLDVTDDTAYGYRYEGENGQREGAAFAFEGAGEDLVLYYTAYDIDSANEVTVELNGAPVGQLATTGNNASRDDLLILPASAQAAGRNSLVFRQRSPGYVWGVTSLLLVEAEWCPPAG